MSSDKTFEGGGVPSPALVPESTTPCLMVIEGSEKGAIYTLEEGDTTLGRQRERADIIFTDREISRAHAVITLSEGRLSIRDLNSTNGVFVNGKRIERHQLCGGDRLALGKEVLLQVTLQDHTVRKLMENLYLHATQDELTGVFNRASFLSRLRGKRGGFVAMVDIDKFKVVNDTWGHAAGDAVLKQLARRLRQSLGTEGIVGRFGGEEFVLYLDSDMEDPKRKCQEILKSVSSRNFRVAEGEEGSHLKVTVSVGLVALTEDPLADLKRADGALYQAKAAGRNTVIVADI